MRDYAIILLGGVSMKGKIKARIDNAFHVEGGVLRTRDYLTYAVAGNGQNLSYAMVTGYLMIFYTDILRIDPATVGVMFFAVNLWDGINDVLMGSLVDKTRTKWGKMRPYLLIAPLPLAIITTMLFIAPDISYTGRVVYMYVTYILWDAFYTISDVPYWSLVTVLSPNREERTKLVNFARIATGGGVVVAILLISGLTMLKENELLPLVARNDQRIYLFAAIFASIGCVSLLPLGFFGTKERIAQSEKAPSFKESFRFLFSNKPLMIVTLSSLLAFPRMLQTGITVYVANYILGGNQWVMVLSAPTLLGMLVASTFVPKLVKKLGLVKAHVYANLFSILPLCALYFVDPHNIALMLLMMSISGIAGGVLHITPVLLVADCVDYAEWKYAQRGEGVSFSISNFISKANAALQNVTLGLLLTLFHFAKPVTVNEILPQSAFTLKGIWAMNSLIPAIGCLICIVPMLFYELKGEQLQTIQQELSRKRSNAGKENEA